LFKDEKELRVLWSDPKTRKALLQKLEDAGYGSDELKSIQKIINAENSDIFDVLEYIAFAIQPISREKRVAQSQDKIFEPLTIKQKEFMEFVLCKYIESGVEELDQEKLPKLLTLKYQALKDASQELGGINQIKRTFIEFQKCLYEEGIEA